MIPSSEGAYTQFEICRRCLEPLNGHERAIGICTWCIADSSSPSQVKVPRPGYGKNKTQESSD